MPHLSVKLTQVHAPLVIEHRLRKKHDTTARLVETHAKVDILTIAHRLIKAPERLKESLATAQIEGAWVEPLRQPLGTTPYATRREWRSHRIVDRTLPHTEGAIL